MMVIAMKTYTGLTLPWPLTLSGCTCPCGLNVNISCLFLDIILCMFGMRLIARLGFFWRLFSEFCFLYHLTRAYLTNCINWWPPFHTSICKKDRVIPEKLIFSVYRILEEVSVVIIICTLCLSLIYFQAFHFMNFAIKLRLAKSFWFHT